MGPGEGRERALEVLRSTVGRLAEETLEVPGGRLYRTPSLPLVWTLNQLRLTGSSDLAEIGARADAHQGDQPYRHVVVEDDVALRAAVAGGGRGGWELERDVQMVLDPSALRRALEGAAAGLGGGAPAGGAADWGGADGGGADVVEVTEDQMLDLMAMWLLEEREDITAAGLEQVLEYNRREGRLWDELRLGVVEDGVTVALTKLRSDGSTAWVEDVYTAPAARRRGYGRRLVTRAAQLAVDGGHDFTFIVADAEDWPQHLYAAIGFRPVGTSTILHRMAPAP